MKIPEYESIDHVEEGDIVLIDGPKGTRQIEALLLKGSGGGGSGLEFELDYGYLRKKITFELDGSIVETSDVGTKKTVFNEDGSITETMDDYKGNQTIKKTIFEKDGSITTTITNSSSE